jgi:hypothetical protein
MVINHGILEVCTLIANTPTALHQSMCPRTPDTKIPSTSLWFELLIDRDLLTVSHIIIGLILFLFIAFRGSFLAEGTTKYYIFSYIIIHIYITLYNLLKQQTWKNEGVKEASRKLQSSTDTRNDKLLLGWFQMPPPQLVFAWDLATLGLAWK